MSNWMSELPEAVQRLPLNRILFPGSHCAAAYRLATKVPLKPLRQRKRWALRWAPPMRKHFERIHLRQSESIYGQLMRGSRYIDLSLSTPRRSGRVYASAGPAFCLLERALADIERFLTHHQEVVLLRVRRDPAHYGSSEAAQSMLNQCVERLSPYLVRRSQLSELSLLALRQGQRRLILFSDIACPLDKVWNQRWLEAACAYNLLAGEMLVGEFLSTNESLGSMNYVLHLPIATRSGRVAEKTAELHSAMYEWLKNWRVSLVNVCSVDFIDDRFVQWCIQHNLKRVINRTK